MSLEMNTIENGGLKLEVKDNILFVSGNVVSANPGEFLDPFLSEFHKRIVENNFKEVTVNISELAFLNSSGIRAFVEWILLLESLTEDKKYKIILLCNCAKNQWQKISINTLTYLVPGFVIQKEV